MANILAIFGLSCLVVLSTGQQFNISTTPSNATISVGQNLTIECDSGTNSIFPSLEINGNPTDANDRVDNITPDNSSARIQLFVFISANRNDNGLNFTCVGPGNLVSNIVTLKVLFIPIISLITNGAGLEGQSATVTFVVDANPQIIASDVSVSLNNTPEVQINGGSVSLNFSNLMRSNDGQHTVTVTNSEGSDTENFNLLVYYGPTFTRSDDTKTVAVGGSITLDCSIQESNPQANVSFTTDANDRTNVLFNSGTNMIMISNAVLGNSGVYTCTADSGQATTTLTYTLNVESMSVSGTVTITASATVSTSTTSPSPTLSPSPTSGAIGSVGLISTTFSVVLLAVTVFFN